MIDDTEDLEIVKPVYTVLEYNDICFKTLGILWNYYRDKIDDFDVNDSVSDGKSFKHKTKIVEQTEKDHHKPEINKETRTNEHNYQNHF